MRFVDLLRTTVLLSAGAATTLAVITVAAATTDGDENAVVFAAGWWFVAVVIGAFVGRRTQVSQAIGRLLANAKAATMMPEHRPAAVAVNRLWPLLLSTVAAGALGLIAPQIPGIAAGFAVIWALGVAAAGVGRPGDRGARRRDVLRRADVAGARRCGSCAPRASGARCRRSTAAGSERRAA